MTNGRLPRDASILVVGGGPAGASTAWHCAMAGHQVVLVDRAQFPRAKPCAEYVSPESSRILDRMGALKAIESHAALLTGMSVHPPSGRCIRGEFLASHGFRGFRDAGFGIRREILDTHLVERARIAGVQVIENAKVESLVRNGSGRVVGAHVRTVNGVTLVNTDVIVGADGLRSVVAKRLGLAHRARWPNRMAFVAHYTGMPDVTSIGEMHVTANGYVGVANVGSGITNIAIVVPADRARNASGNAEYFFTEWLRQSPIASRIAEAQQVTSVRVTGPFASHARRAGVAGALLVGDAADFFDPFTGEGIYSALKGGELIAPFVSQMLESSKPASSLRVRDVVSAYQSARQRSFGGKWRIERLIGRAVSSARFMNLAARVISSDRQFSDLLIGVTGDFVPPSALLNPRTLLRLSSRVCQRTFQHILGVPYESDHVYRP